MFNVVLLNRCNLHCSYCFAEDYMHQKDTEKKSTDEMSLETFKEVVDFLLRSGTDHISLIGGEPTLHPRFKEIWRLAPFLRVPFSLKSNALWPSSLLEFFNTNSGPLYRYFLNVNGPDRLVPTQWKQVKRNVLGLKSEFVDLQFNIEAPDFNYDWIIELALEANIKRIYWSLAAPIVGEKKLANNHAPYEQFKGSGSKNLEKFLTAAGNAGIVTIGTHGATPCLFDSLTWQILKNKGAAIDGRCLPGFDIFPDKTIHYCFPLKDFFVPQTIADLPAIGDAATYFAREMLGYRALSFPWNECPQCPEMASGSCHGGCLAQKKASKLERESVQNVFPSIVPLRCGEAPHDLSLQKIWEAADGKKTLGEIQKDWILSYASSAKLHHAQDLFHKNIGRLLAFERLNVTPLINATL